MTESDKKSNACEVICEHIEVFFEFIRESAGIIGFDKTGEDKEAAGKNSGSMCEPVELAEKRSSVD